MNLFCNLWSAWPALAPEVMAMPLYVPLRLFGPPTEESASALFRRKAV